MDKHTVPPPALPYPYPLPNSCAHPPNSRQMTSALPLKHIRRQGAFYHTSHPDIFWTESWGPKPSLGRALGVADLSDGGATPIVDTVVLIPPANYKRSRESDCDHSSAKRARLDTDPDLSPEPCVSNIVNFHHFLGSTSLRLDVSIVESDYTQWKVRRFR
jgi:hypothetical protein